MVRIRRLAAALAALALLLAAVRATPGRAQSLQPLTVVSFALSADTARPQVDVPFHLIVVLHVRERVTAIDNLELPILAELELLGDERSLQSGPSGTEYRETIAVVAHRGGTIAIGPAVLQAVDARDRRAKQYSTNGLTLNVTGASSVPLPESDALMGIAAVAFRFVLLAAGLACAVVLVVLIFRRRPLAPQPVPAIVSLPAPAPIPRARLQRDELRDALIVLRAERTRGTAVRVRALVWRMTGASEGETLADVLRRPDATSPPMRELLRSLERAAFTYDDDLTAAIDAACNTLDRYLG